NQDKYLSAQPTSDGRVSGWSRSNDVDYENRNHPGWDDRLRGRHGARRRPPFPGARHSRRAVSAGELSVEPARDRRGGDDVSGRLHPVRSDQLAHPAEVPLVFDGEGYWHGRLAAGRSSDPDPYLAATAARGYNVVFADGRVRFVPAAELLNHSPGRPPGLLYRD